MKKRLVIILLAVVLALGCAGIGAWAAANYGTQSDPLIAQSYLDEVLRPQLEREFGAALDEAAGGLDAAAGAFASVDLSGGDVRLAAGAEVLCLAEGASAGGTMIDATAGGAVSAGSALEANHLYIAAGDGISLSGAGEALIRGGYSPA